MPFPSRGFRWLVRLLPSDVREAHGREMEQVLRSQYAERRPGRRAVLRFWLAALVDVLRVAPRHHVEALARDVRFAGRALRRQPAFASAAIATIALGIGAATAVFAVVNAVLLRPLPYDDAARLGLVWAVDPDGSRTWLSAPELDDVAERASTLDGVAGLTDLRLALTGDGPPEELDVVAVSSSFFRVTGVRPHIGRALAASDDTPAAARVVILSHGLWTRRYGGSPDVVGRTLSLDGNAYEVAGVLPASFRFLPPSSVFPPDADAWVALQPHLSTRARDVRYLHAIARVREEGGFAAAKEELASIGRTLSAQFGGAYRGRSWTLEAVPLQDDLVRGVRPALLVLFAVVTLVLLIACANVAALLLSRAESRRREMAVRAALGASRARVMRQLITEGLVLAASGAALGLALAAFTPALGRLPVLTALPRFGEISIDWRVVLFAAGASFITAMVFTIVPALELTRRDGRESQQALRTNARGARAVRAGRLLATAEIAMAAAVLVVALLLGKTFASLMDTDPGFRSGDVIAARVALPRRYATAADITRFFDAATGRLAQTPGVSAAAAVTQLPLSGATLGSTILSAPDAGGEPIRTDVDLRGITPDYFRALSVPLIQGRAFSAADSASSPRVAIVDETFARRVWPDGDAVGRRIRWFRQPDVELEVVGVVRGVRHAGLDREPKPTVYRPHAQYARPTMYLVAKGTEGRTLSAAQIAAAVHAVDPQQPVSEPATMPSLVSRSMARPGFGASLGLTFASIALALAGVGIYGLLAFSVAERAREIGVRLAIGATPGHIVKMIVGEGTRLSVAGVTVGLLAAALFAPWARSTVPDLAGADAATFALAAAGVLAIALCASWLPSRRASRIAPANALRPD